MKIFKYILFCICFSFSLGAIGQSTGENSPQGYGGDNCDEYSKQHEKRFFDSIKGKIQDPTDSVPIRGGSEVDT